MSDPVSSKLTVIRHLYKQGYERQNVINLLIFIDWVLTPPDVLGRKVCLEVMNFKENLKMEYVTSFERFAKEEGIEQGIKQGIEKGIAQTRQILLESLKISLEIKFGNKGLPLLPAVSQFKSPEDLIALQNKLKTAQSIEELESWWRAHDQI